MDYLYRHFNQAGLLLYVGISLNAINRLSQHKDHAHWFALIASVTIEPHSTRAEAIEAERKAITTEKPLHNIYRPTEKEKKEIKTRTDMSRKDLLHRVVRYNAMYTIAEVQDAIDTSKNQVLRWIQDGLLGVVKIGEYTGRWGTKDIIRITGWQFIDFIEHLEDVASHKGSVNV